MGSEGERKGKGKAGKEGKEKGKDKGEKGNRKGDWKGDGGKGKKDGGYKGDGKGGKDDGSKGGYSKGSDKGKGGYRDRGEKGDMQGVEKERVARGNIKNMFEKVSHEDGSTWGVPEISKKLSWLLRRGKAVVETDDEGWVNVTDILKFEGLPKLSFDRLMEVAKISNAEKLRYEIEGSGTDQKMRAAGDKTAAAIAEKAAREAKERWTQPSREKADRTGDDGDSAPAGGESDEKNAAAAQGLNSEAPVFKPSGAAAPEAAMQQHYAQQQAMQQYFAQVQYMQQLQAMQQMQAMQALQAKGAQGKGGEAKDGKSAGKGAGNQNAAAQQMQAMQMQQLQAMQLMQQMKGSGKSQS